MKDLSISLVQTSLLWQQAEANCAHIHKLLNDQNVTSDLIVLPEMFNSGFTLDAIKVAETMDGDTVAWMRRVATEFD